LSLTLQSVEILEDGRIHRATYKAVHSTPGRSGTTLDVNVAVKVGFGQTWVTLPDLEVLLKEENVEAGLDKMADWLERTAQAIRERGKPTPVFCNYAKD
jgi:hypothetical protein